MAILLDKVLGKFIQYDHVRTDSFSSPSNVQKLHGMRKYWIHLTLFFTTLFALNPFPWWSRCSVNTAQSRWFALSIWIRGNCARSFQNLYHPGYSVSIKLQRSSWLARTSWWTYVWANVFTNKSLPVRQHKWLNTLALSANSVAEPISFCTSIVQLWLHFRKMNLALIVQGDLRRILDIFIFKAKLMERPCYVREDKGNQSVPTPSK